MPLNANIYYFMKFLFLTHENSMRQRATMTDIHGYHRLENLLLISVTYHRYVKKIFPLKRPVSTDRLQKYI